MLVSIAIPTFNRPALLREGLISIANQTYPSWEVVIIDDGSTPPIDAHDIQDIVGNRFILIRQDTSQGVVAAKNAGIRHASGDVIMHLDDDDLLAANTLELAVHALNSHPDLDGVFLNVEPFGLREAGTRRNQERALSTVLNMASAHEDEELVFFNDQLFKALLRTVPMAFQRPFARKQAWSALGDTDERLYYGEPDWALRAAMCFKFALLKARVSKWRVDGQNFASQPAHRLKHSINNIRIKEHIYDLTRNLTQDRHSLCKDARFALGQAYFDHAYQLFLNDTRLDALKYLFRAASTAPNINHAKLLMRLMMSSPKRGHLH